MNDPEISNETFGQWLQAVRGTLGWSQATMARRSGVDKRTVERTEAGHNPQALTLARFVGAVEAGYAERGIKNPVGKLLPDKLVASIIGMDDRVKDLERDVIEHSRTAEIVDRLEAVAVRLETASTVSSERADPEVDLAQVRDVVDGFERAAKAVAARLEALRESRRGAASDS